MLEVKVERCAGIDVGKKFLAVCVMIGLANQKPTVKVRRFGTNGEEVERLRVLNSRRRVLNSRRRVLKTQRRMLKIHP